jgi:hypothetical protein
VKRFRLSIATFMGFVLLIAVGLALVKGLQPTSVIGASIIFALTLVVLMTATLGSLFNRKTIWVGFSLFGWRWLFLTFGPLPQSDRTPLPVPLTTMCLKRIAAWAYPELILNPNIKSIGNNHIDGTYEIFSGRIYTVPYAFLQIGNSLFSLLVAGVGSVVGRFFVHRTPERVEERS